jgi:hypothetical protein
MNIANLMQWGEIFPLKPDLFVFHAFAGSLVSGAMDSGGFQPTIPKYVGVRNLHIRKFDNHESSYTSNGKSYEVSINRVQNAGQTVRRLERRLWELRLNRALRRFQGQIRGRIQRRCELRLFVILRMQFMYRSRNRIRAAVRIQRFVREKVIRCGAPTVQYS